MFNKNYTQYIPLSIYDLQVQGGPSRWFWCGWGRVCVRAMVVWLVGGEEGGVRLSPSTTYCCGVCQQGVEGVAGVWGERGVISLSIYDLQVRGGPGRVVGLGYVSGRVIQQQGYKVLCNRRLGTCLLQPTSPHPSCPIIVPTPAVLHTCCALQPSLPAAAPSHPACPPAHCQITTSLCCADVGGHPGHLRL